MPKYPCTTCGLSFPSEEALLAHVGSAHPEKEVEGAPTNSASEPGRALDSPRQAAKSAKINHATWINTIDEGDAQGELKEAYMRVRTSRGRVANIFKVHSLNPDSLKAHLDLYMGIMYGNGGLSRQHREMIAVAVSATNHCPYCVAHHSAALGKYVGDEALIKGLGSSPETTPLGPKEKAMVEYAVILTRNPSALTERNIAELRKIGMKDEEILHLALVASYFNFVNRLASGLGVSLEAELQTGYKY